MVSQAKQVLTGEEINKLDIRVSAETLVSLIHLSSSRGTSMKKGLMAPMTREDFAVAPMAAESAADKFLICPFNSDNLDIDGLDFTVGKSIYEYNLAYSRVSLEQLERFVDTGATRHDLDEGQEFVFQQEKIYYVLSEETVRIPNNLNLFVDSKSTIGRLACICSDATLPNLLKKESTNLVGVVRPGVFPLKIHAEKSKLFQGVFKYNTDSHMTRKQLLKSGKIRVEVNGKEKSIEDCIDEDKLILSFSTKRAYVSKRNLKNVEPIDVDRTDLDWTKYFEEIKGKSGGEFTLEPGRFYLFGTQEDLRFDDVCGRISRDLGGPSTGLWTQFAGIIHAGFHGPITLECKTDVPRVIRPGDLAGYVEVDQLAGEVNLASGQGNYLGQDAPKLPKVFR
jgi:deoxycytidine triphosphate deaminase